ncbi:hypothetical protein A2210_02975 [Candidatus Woesebacteria bacterium RIFOXYA1_FULL_40_18]|uniref:Uncharacterized protein n=2 Tax=Candidatus Woeseibacteriota TaxID=1752722 RepID=A0A1F8CH24_9BACT|nr:MAG: hypothetical protein A2210_02975 [Candidatus Woesebacteria bacterium RIFOXYA1_FULL_40_18]OGM80947.1 MAG: hypothetical protein A2361_01140 [Candidatus Woesebacteria bacterium RIFOXYB1_FULL_40_26]
MSKLFFDHLVSLEDVEKEIKKVATSKEEKEELWGLVDEIMHHKVMGCILDKLPRDNHEEFLEMFHKHPHDETLIDYLQEKIGENIEELIKGEIGNLAFEILNEIKIKAEKE